MLVIDEPIVKDIPHEPGEQMGFKRLSWRELRDARRIAQAEQRQILRELGAEFLKAVMDSNEDDPESEKRIERAKKRLQNDESNFDTEVILSMSINFWTYEEEVSTKAIHRLDEKTAMWAKQVAIDLTVGDDDEEESVPND